MNKIKLILALSLGVVILGVSSKSKVEAASYYDGWNFTLVDASSAVIFTGGGRVRAIYGSTDTAMMGNYCILIDTPGVVRTNPVFPTAYSTDRWKSPSLYFVSTNTATGSGIPTSPATYLLMDYGTDGVLISSGAYLGKTAAGSGGARQVGVLWRK